MATADLIYSNSAVSTTITMDLAGLASSSTFVAGRESTQIDNTSTKYLDAIVYGRFSVGTTPTTPCSFNVYLWAADASLATTPIDVLDGTDSAETLTNTTVLNSALRVVRSCQILATTSDLAYDVLPFSVVDALGYMPPFWGLYVAHNMTAALRNTSVNTNQFRFLGIKQNIA